MLPQWRLAQRGRSWLDVLRFGAPLPLQAWRHYPQRDVVDRSGRWQFYFHAHDLPRVAGEIGHLHLFRRRADGVLTPVIALALDPKGWPLAWFSTNQWVTGGLWGHPKVLAAAIRDCTLEVAGPAASVSAWLAAMVRWYAPELAQIVGERDADLLRLAQTVPGASGRSLRWLRQCRDLEVLRVLPIDLQAKVAATDGQVPRLT